MAGAFDAKVDISTKEARDNIQALRKEVAQLGAGLMQLDGIIKANKGNVAAIAHQFTQLVAAQRAAASATKETAQADIAAARAAALLNAEKRKQSETDARNTTQAARSAAANAQGALASTRAAESETRRGIAADRAAQATQRGAQAQNQMKDSLSNSRYLMYDVGATYGVLSAALMTIPAATAAVSAAYQKDFAQVIRVNEEFQHSSEAAQQMKSSLKDLATDMPVGFDELSRITQLGSQMGVENEKLKAFTETTAKFVAVTGISADTGATLFGRLESSFTDDVKKFPDFFERVGSSIAYVGAKTVATDPEIAAMLNQIAPLGAAAGMSADQVTGLSAALASVRVRPELARGALTKVFGDINRYVAEGAPELEEYGKVMGMTGDQAAKLWKTDSSAFFSKFIAGLNGTLKKNGELTTTLDALGIKELRVSDAMTKLAVGNDVLVTSMDAANKGFKEGTALNEMAKPVFETVVAHLTEMVNAWKNLGDTLGSGALAPLGLFVDMAKNVAIWLRNISENADGSITPIGHLIQILMGFATVTALFLGFKAAQAFVMAGMIGFQQAAARGMAGGLSLGNQVRTLAQTMLIAKGATEAQSRALLGQVGVMRGLMVATTASAANVRKAAASTDTMTAASLRGAGGVKGLASGLLGLVGGPIGAGIGALALLAGALINTKTEAESAGKAIADAMGQGAAATLRAAAEQLANTKVDPIDTVAFSTWGKNLRQLAEESGVSFDKLALAATKGKDAVKEITPEFDRIAQSKGFKDFNDFYNNGGTDVAGLAVLKKKLEGIANESVTVAENTKAVEKAAPLAGKALKDMGEPTGETTAKLDKMTKALKDLNDEVFGVINNEAAVQAALQNLGESLYKSKSFSTDNESGRANLQNFEDAADKSRERFFTLMKNGTVTAEQAAQGYADFIQGLLNEIRAQGGDTSGIESLAMQTAQRFQAAIGANPAKMPVDADTIPAEGTVQQLVDNTTSLKATLTLGMDPSNADANMMLLAQNIAQITKMPYNVVINALTDPASDQAKYIEDLLIQITSGEPYTASVDADTTAAVANVQNFVAFARTELAHLQAQMNNGVGLADGEGSMSPDQKAQYAAIGAPKKVAATRQVRVPSTLVPKTNLGQNLQGIGDGFRKAGQEAEKAGKKAKQAAEDMADGITDAVRAAEDYGNRLKTGLMSAYNQQYALTTATDAYHSALNAINKKREDEIKQVEELRDKIRQLNDERDKELITANKAKIEQKISIKYGETDRAADYGNQAQTALDNASAKQKEIDASKKEADTVQAGIGLLTGYSDAAIANREALRGLESKTLDMIAAYAAQGHSIDEVRAYAQQLTGQFQTDVGQLGFNQTAVQALQGDMGRYIDVVNRVPEVKPTKIEADTDQATQDVTAFNDLLDGIPSVIPVKVEVTSTSAKGIGEAWSNVTMADGSVERVNRGQSGDYQLGSNWSGGPVKGFAEGGMVPGKPPADPHKDNLMAKVDGKGLIGIRSREWIIPEPAVDYYGPSVMQAIQTMKMPKFAMGGSPSGASGGSGAIHDSVVELGAATLAAMAEMRQEIKLFTDNRTIAESANAGNKQLAAEGHH